MADHMTPGLDAAMIRINHFAPLQLAVGRRISEQHLDRLERRWPVLFQRQQIIALAVENGLGDAGLRAHCIDRHQRPFEFKPLQQQRNGGDFVGFAGNRLLAQHQPLLCCPGRTPDAAVRGHSNARECGGRSCRPPQ